MAFLPVDEQLELISRGTEEVIPLNDLRKKLEKSIHIGQKFYTFQGSSAAL